MKLEVTQTTKEAIHYMVNSKKIIQEWDAWNRSRRNEGVESEAFTELTKKGLIPSKAIIDIISGEIELVIEPEKKYVVILPEVGSNTGIYWNYTYINGNMEVDYADIPTSVTQFTKRDLLALPKWVRDLAKEVEEWEKDTLSF